MSKRICYIGLLVVFILSLFPLAGDGEVLAREKQYSEEDISCVYSVKAEFPLTLQFAISAESDATITDIRLHYTTDRQSFAPVTSEAYIEFAPDTSVDTEWTWDMRKTGGLPPGTDIQYWWTVENTDGDRFESSPTPFRFEDNRYSWRSLSEGKLTIYWYEGEQAFAAELMSAAQQALTRLENDTGAYLIEPAEIYIYANSQDLQGAMIFPQEWTGGVAFTQYNTVVLGIEPNNLSWGKSAMTHELTHLVVQQMTVNPYTGLPTWLNEGLAMYNEGELSSGLAARLKNAAADNGLISVRSLSSPFSTDTEVAYLSYAQSYSLVEFLITVYGQDKMLELLTNFSKGSSYDGALEKVYGFNTEGLDTLWQDYVNGSYLETGVKMTAAVPASTWLDSGLSVARQPAVGSPTWRWDQ